MAEKQESKAVQVNPQKYEVIEECYFNGSVRKPGEIVHSVEDLPKTIYKKVK